MAVNEPGFSTIAPESNISAQEILIKTIELKNVQTLELYDASRRVANDRWLVSLVARIAIPTDSSLFDESDSSVNNMEEIRNAIGEKIVFERRRERNFILNAYKKHKKRTLWYNQ